MDTGHLQSLNLEIGRIVAAGNDGARVTHPAPRRSGAPGDETHDWLGGLAGLDELGSLDLGVAADLADHDDAFRLRVIQEQLQAIHEVGAVDRIAADADAGRLPQARRRGLRHRFICERAGAGDNTDLATPMDMTRHDADLALVRGDDARAVRPDQPGLGAVQRPPDGDHVQDGYTFRDADHQRDLRVDRFQDGDRGERRRDIDHAGVGAGHEDGLGDGVEHRQVEILGAALARSDAADHGGAIGNRLLGVKVPCAPVKPWQMTLVWELTRTAIYAASFTALTTFSAASARLSADRMGRPDSLRIFLPRSTLVPSRRTTSGT